MSRSTDTSDGRPRSSRGTWRRAHQGSCGKPPGGRGMGRRLPRTPGFQPQLSEPGILRPTWGPKGWAACLATKPQARVRAVALASHGLGLFLLERALGSGRQWRVAWRPQPPSLHYWTRTGREAGSHEEATGSEKQASRTQRAHTPHKPTWGLGT